MDTARVMLIVIAMATAMATVAGKRMAEDTTKNKFQFFVNFSDK